MGRADGHDCEALNAEDAVCDILDLVHDGDDETSELATALICEIEELALEEEVTAPVDLLASLLKKEPTAKKVAIVAKLSQNHDLCAAIARSGAAESLIAMVECHQEEDRTRYAIAALANVAKSGGMVASLETLSRLLVRLEQVVKGDESSIGLDAGLKTLAGLLFCAHEAVRRRAAGLLCDLANKSACDNLVKFIIDAEAVHALVRCICDDGDLTLTKALKLLELLAGEKEGALQISASGVLPALVKLVDESQLKAADIAMQTLFKISRVKETLKSLREVGVVDSMLRVAREKSGDDRLSAFQTLNNLTSDMESLKLIVTAGGVAMAMEMTSDGQGLQRQQGVRLLGNLAFDNETERIIGSMGAIPCIIECLRCGTRGEKEDAAFSLYNLSFDSTNAGLILAAGGLEALLLASHDMESEGLEDALSALNQLATKSSDANKLVASAGGIPQIVRSLQSTSEGVLAEAAKLVRTLTQEKDNRLLVAEAGGVTPLLELIQEAQPERELLQFHAVAVIESLSGEPMCAQEIVSKGGIERLANLAFSAGDGSKISTCAAGALKSLAAFPEHRAAVVEACHDRKQPTEFLGDDAEAP